MASNFIKLYAREDINLPAAAAKNNVGLGYYTWPYTKGSKMPYLVILRKEEK